MDLPDILVEYWADWACDFSYESLSAIVFFNANYLFYMSVRFLTSIPVQSGMESKAF